MLLPRAATFDQIMANVRGAVFLSVGLIMVAAGCGGSGSPPEPPAARADASQPTDATVVATAATTATSSEASTAGADNAQTGVIIAGGEVRINGSVVGSSNGGAGIAPGGTVTGSGVIITEARALSGFHAVALHGFGTVDIVRGDQEGVQVEADDNVVPLVRTEVVGGRLIVGLVRGTSLRNATLRIHIQATTLDELVTDGSVDASVTGLAGTRFALKVRGSGDIDLAGTSEAFSVELDGSGDIDAGGLVAQRATVRIEGSGDVRVQATSTLDATIEGSGDLTYLGTPALSTNISGSGDVSAD
ncbi:MAG: head GIN domain-containing protein [Acidimicrobiales bacterium]